MMTDQVHGAHHIRAVPRSGAARAGSRLSDPHPYLHAHEFQIPAPNGYFQPARWTVVPEPKPAPVGTVPPVSGAVRAGWRLSNPHPYLLAHEFQILASSGDFQAARWTVVPAPAGTMCRHAGKIR